LLSFSFFFSLSPSTLFFWKLHPHSCSQPLTHPFFPNLSHGLCCIMGFVEAWLFTGMGFVAGRRGSSPEGVGLHRKAWIFTHGGVGLHRKACISSLRASSPSSSVFSQRPYRHRRPSFPAMGYYPGQAHCAPRVDAENVDERKERRKKGEEKNNKIYLQQ
jgi:hypothetical protein